MSRARAAVRAACIALAAVLASPAPARADASTASKPADRTRVLLGVDRDDDDLDGRPDAEQTEVAPAADLFALPLPVGNDRMIAVEGDAVRVLVDGRPLARGGMLPAHATRVELQAVRPGHADVRAFGRLYSVAALEVRAVDGKGKLVDPVRSHASMERTPPARIEGDPFASHGELDAVRFVLAGLPEDLPSAVYLVARGPSHDPIDAQPDVELASVPCPDGLPRGLACGSTRPIRSVPDEIDRDHPVARDRSILAMLGGALQIVGRDGRKLGSFRVGGPRVSALGPIQRYQGRLRVFLVRARRGGPPPLGGDEAGALALARAEVAQAASLWAACGIGFGAPSELAVKVVDPPHAHLVAMGCDHGLPASGGVVRLRVEGRDVTAKIEPGIRPAGAARVVGAALAAAGFSVAFSDNAVIGAGVHGSSDVLVRRKDGQLAQVEPPAQGPVSSDPTLPVCIGRVDLEDGLQHFTDIDAIAGTVEERTLIKAFDDGDPGTVEVFWVPSFGGGGRIGESFIAADGGAVRNVLIEDRAGVRADRASFALAHELGHILLDEPGHPDDFGRDTPTRLMDADAANPTAYGPRRLLVDECARALRQSGPDAAVPLLRPWPLLPLGKEK